MSLETWVGLLRNGLCVVSDTLPDEYDQFGRFANGMSTMNALIAPLQFAAAIFNLKGAIGFPKALKDVKAARALRDVASATKNSLAEAAAERRVVDATVSACYAFLSLTLSPAFVILAKNSCKRAAGWEVEWALGIMQIGLFVALVAMRVEAKATWARAENCEAIAQKRGPGDASAKAQACCDAGLVVDDGDEGQTLSLSECVFSPLGEKDAPSAVKARCGALAKKASDIASKHSTTKEALLAHHAATKRNQTVGLAVWWLNVVAFFGYAVFPLTYFGPFARDPYHEWAGNFAGDLAWTVEPALVIVAAMTAPKAKAKSA